MAARTERIQLGLGAVIIPWNDPLRVVEKFSMLDHLSNGRCQIGFGRGLAKLEYDRFGLRLLRSDHGAHAGANDRGLLGCDLRERFAEVFLMVERDGRYRDD